MLAIVNLMGKRRDLESKYETESFDRERDAHIPNI